MVKNLPAMLETMFNPWVGKISWRRKWQPTPVFFPGEFHGQRSLAGYSPRGCKESVLSFINLFHCLFVCVLGWLQLKCPTLCDPVDHIPPGSVCPWDFPGKNTGVGCHFLLQEIYPTQELNLGLQHCRQILFQLSYKGSSYDPAIPLLSVYPEKTTIVSFNHNSKRHMYPSVH